MASKNVARSKEVSYPIRRENSACSLAKLSMKETTVHIQYMYMYISRFYQVCLCMVENGWVQAPPSSLSLVPTWQNKWQDVGLRPGCASDLLAPPMQWPSPAAFVLSNKRALCCSTSIDPLSKRCMVTTPVRIMGFLVFETLLISWVSCCNIVTCCSCCFHIPVNEPHCPVCCIWILWIPQTQ